MEPIMACRLDTCKNISMNSAPDSTGDFGNQNSRSVYSTLVWRIRQSRLLSFIHSHFSFSTVTTSLCVVHSSKWWRSDAWTSVAGRSDNFQERGLNLFFRRLHANRTRNTSENLVKAGSTYPLARYWRLYCMFYHRLSVESPCQGAVYGCASNYSRPRHVITASHLFR